jgi:poly(3-hydroxybutyrate) depolymerase
MLTRLINKGRWTIFGMLAALILFAGVGLSNAAAAGNDSLTAKYRSGNIVTIDKIYQVPQASNEADKKLIEGRKAFVYISSQANSYNPSAMIVLIAPAGQDPRVFARESGWLQKAEAERAVLAMPVPTMNGGKFGAWTYDEAELTYLKGLYETVRRFTASAQPLDNGNIWLWEVLINMVGYKEGATLAGEFALACPDRFAGVALVDGLPISDYNAVGAKASEHILVPNVSKDYAVKNADIPLPLWLITAQNTKAAVSYWNAVNHSADNLEGKAFDSLITLVYSNPKSPAEQLRITKLDAKATPELTNTIWNNFLANLVRWKNSPDGTIAFHMAKGQVYDIGGQSPYQYRSFRFANEKFDREYFVYLPKTYDGTKDLPVVFSLHGRYEPAWIFSDKNGWNAQAEKGGFIVVYPNAPIKNEWDTADINAPDIKAFPALLDDVAKNFRIDRTRVYVTGFSNGSTMTYNLGLAHPEVITAIAPSNGQLANNMSKNSFFNEENRTNPSAIWNNAVAKMEKGGLRVPLFGFFGDNDNYPLPVAKDSIAEKAINLFITANGGKAEPAGPGEDNSLYYKPTRVLGPKDYAQYGSNADRFRTWSFTGENGIEMVNITVMKNMPHGAIVEEIDATWNFLKQFSKTAYGKLVFTPNK